MRAITQDLVLLDLMMPMLDGWSVLGQRQADPALSMIPVVAMSAGGQPALERACALGADRCVSKPFELENVLDIVRDVYRAADRHGRFAESGS
jgi:diguanylate cyclase